MLCDHKIIPVQKLVIWEQCRIVYEIQFSKPFGAHFEHFLFSWEKKIQPLYHTIPSVHNFYCSSSINFMKVNPWHISRCYYYPWRVPATIMHSIALCHTAVIMIRICQSTRDASPQTILSTPWIQQILSHLIAKKGKCPFKRVAHSFAWICSLFSENWLRCIMRLTEGGKL